jgi:2,3-bisphosphoglycerate-independent phosphoglycerate mutase
MPTFGQKYGLQNCALITAVDLLRGLGVLLGWDLLHVDGMTSFHDTNYAGQGIATVAALDQYDLVLSHVEAPDEASHQADYKTKIAAIEHIDHHIVGPVLQKLRTYPEWRLLVLPDHPTNVATRKHGYAPTCFGLTGTNVKPLPTPKYCETNAKSTALHLEKGQDLMPYFLRGDSD